MNDLDKQNRGKRFNRKEAALYLGVTHGTLAAWAYQGKSDLPFYKIGRKPVYFQSDLDSFIERNIVHPRVNQNALTNSSYAVSNNGVVHVSARTIVKSDQYKSSIRAAKEIVRSHQGKK